MSEEKIKSKSLLIKGLNFNFKVSLKKIRF